jgi:hypothetical protein
VDPFSSVSEIEYQQLNYYYLCEVVPIVLCSLVVMEFVCVIYLPCFEIYNSVDVNSMRSGLLDVAVYTQWNTKLLKLWSCFK